MRRHILTIFLLGAGVAGVLAATRVQREQDYQRLIADGDHALARADLSAAVEAFSGAVTLKPDAMLAYLRRGEAYRRRGANDLSSALRDFRTAATLDPSAPGPQEGLGDVSLARDNPQRAFVHYRQSLALDERSARVQYKYALALYRTGQPEAALRALTFASQLDPRIAEVPYLKALCLADAGRLSDAHEHLLQALALDPTLTSARETLADVSVRLNRPSEELAHLAVLLRDDPERAERHLALGRAYARAGRTDMAVATLSRAAERFPFDHTVFAALAHVWLEQAIATGDRVALQKGLEAARQAGDATSDSGFLTLVGSAWLRVREPRRALRSFEQATQGMPIDPTAYARLAETAERLGMWTAARDALRHEHALASDAVGSAPARARLIRLGDLSMKIGDFPAARDWFEHARFVGADPLVSARLAGAEQAIAKESPLDEPIGFAATAMSARRGPSH
jgi:tetratricopeptide (TPR) repeat protein